MMSAEAMITTLLSRGHAAGFVAERLGISLRLLLQMQRGEARAAPATIDKLVAMVETPHLPNVEPSKRGHRRAKRCRMAVWR